MMKQTGRRFLSLLLVVSMLLTILPAALAAEAETVPSADDVPVSEELAEQIVAEMLGVDPGQAAVSEEGYEFRVAADTFNELVIQAQQQTTGNELPEDYVDDSNEDLEAILAQLEPSLMTAEPAAAATKVEVAFVVDTTGSMSDSIRAVKNNIASFAQYLSEKKLSLRLALIEYRDITCDGDSSTVVHQAEGSAWMNVPQFVEALTAIRVDGGGDIPETPLDGLAHLTEGTLAWSSDAYKFGILVTDAGYKVNNNHGITDLQDMVQRLNNHSIQMSTITSRSDAAEYGDLAGYTGGIQADLYSDFGTILRDYADVVIGGAQPSQDYTVRVTDVDTGVPLSGVTATWNGGKAGPTDANGLMVITSRNNPLRSVILKRAGYQDLTYDTLELVSQSGILLRMAAEDAPGADDSVPVLRRSNFVNPKSASAAPDGPYITLLGKKFNLLTGLDFAFGTNIFGGKLDIEHDKENKTYEVIVGAEPEDAADKGDWKDSYQQAKSLVNLFGGKTGGDLYNQFRSLRKFEKNRHRFLFPVEGYAAGYAEFSYATGELKFNEGGVVLCLQIKEKSKSWPLAPMPCIFFKVKFKVEAEGKFALVQVTPTGKSFGLGSTTVAVKPSLAGTVNLGVDRIGYAGGGLKGKLTAAVEFPFQQMSESVNVKLDGSFVFEIKLLGFHFDDEFPFGSLQLYPRTAKAASAVELLSVEQLNEMQLIGRPQSVPTLLGTGEDHAYYRNGVYEDAAPQLLQLKDGSWLLVWVDAAPDRAEQNMTALYYASSADGTTWTEPRMVYDDETGDFGPHLIQTGDGMPLLVWQNDKAPYTSAELDLPTRMAGIEVCASFYDAAAGTFGKPTALNGLSETAAELAVQAAATQTGAAIFWLENSENNPALATGINQLVSSTWDGTAWSAPAAVDSSLGVLNGFATGTMDGAAYAACYEQDSRQIKLMGQGKTTTISCGEVDELQILGNALYWVDESGMYRWSGGSRSLETDLFAGLHPQLLECGGQMAAIFRQNMEIGSEYLLSVKKNGTWTSPVQLTDYGMEVGNVSAVLNGDSLIWAAGRTAADGSASDLLVDMKQFERKIQVNEKAFLSLFALPTDEQWEIFTEIANEGQAESGVLQASFYQGDTLLATSPLYLENEADVTADLLPFRSLLPGEQTAVIGLLKPTPELSGTLEVRITDASGVLCGTATLTLPEKPADLTVTDVTVARTEDGASVTAKVKNIGLAAAADTTVTLTQEGTDLEQTEKLGTLTPGQEKTISYEVDGSYLEEKTAYDYKRMLVTAQTTSYEPMIGNNSSSGLLAPLPVKDLRLKGEKVIHLPVGGTYTAEYELLPAEKNQTFVTWMSNNIAIATVENGTITAQTPGQVQIAVLTTDVEGRVFRDTMTVIVDGDKNVAVAGIELDQTEAKLKIGKTITVKATVKPADATNQEVQWTAADPEILSLTVAEDTASVELTALQEGQTTVTALTADGGYSAQLTVTVTKLQALEHVPAREATCVAPGTVEHWVDEDGTCYADAAGKTELTDVSTPVNPDHHVGGVELRNVRTATTEHSGYSGDMYCKSCGALLEKGRVLPRLPEKEEPVELPFVDVPKDQWFYDSICDAWKEQLIDGMDTLHFAPDGTLTVAQAIKLAAVLHQRDTQGKVTLKNGKDLWFTTYVDYAIANGVIEAAYGSKTAAQLNQAITRTEFVKIFSGALEDDTPINQVEENAIPDVRAGDPNSKEIYTFYRAGILIGSDVMGTFRPGSAIKRAEVAAILVRMYRPEARVEITLKETK